MSKLTLPSKPVLLRRLALAAIAALAGFFYAWALGQGTLEYYYGAAVRSMSMSWHDFIFGAFDPAGTITLDKLYGAFWLQALSVRAFGFHPWAIVLPQVIEGFVAGTAAYAAWLVSSSGAHAPGWLFPAVVAVAVAAIGISLWALLAPRAGVRAGALAAGLVSVALVPAAASASLAANSQGAFDTPFESARTAESVEQAAHVVATFNVAAPQSLGSNTPYVLAAQTVVLPSLVIYDSGLEALPIGRLTGTIPSPTLGQLQADIRAGRFHLVWIATDADPRLKWIATHCTQITKRFYDCVPANAG